MRHDKNRNEVELDFLVGGVITGTDYMELKVLKDGKNFSLTWDYEYGYYPDDVSITYEIRELPQEVAN